jgi:hypothetical protein
VAELSPSELSNFGHSVTIHGPPRAVYALRERSKLESFVRKEASCFLAESGKRYSRARLIPARTLSLIRLRSLSRFKESRCSLSPWRLPSCWVSRSN